jgi:hypothetical protein
VNDPLIAQFAAACGAAGPLDLKVDLAEGGVLAEGTVPMPFALVGRDDACDVTLTDADVNPRHTWLQVVGGRVFAVDLGSRTGLVWPNGATGSGWLDIGIPARIGPFRLWLRTPASPRPTHFPPGYNPLKSDPAAARSRPAVSLEFRNGKRAKDRWTVNRLLTLVGRSPECKIHLTADDIAGFHCGMVLTPAGLWVVDLSGRGVVVNGERMRVSLLRHGAELWVGRFLIGVQYPTAAAASVPDPHSGADLALAEAPGEARQGGGPGPTAPHRGAGVSVPTPEDEVQLGEVPAVDPATGLPSSHIMADAFRLWADGPVSNPIAVGGSGPPAAAVPVPAAPPARPAPPPPPIDLFATTAPGFADAETSGAAAHLLRQLGESHAQMFVQAQQSLGLLVKLFACLRRDQFPAVERELARIQELNVELAQLQGELTRRAAEAAPRPTPRVTTSHPTPVPDQSTVRTPLPDPAALHNWVADRLNALHRERQARWHALVALFGGKPT